MLNLVDLSKTFNRGTINEKKALQNVSLTINDGDFITVIGGNGAGKSTLLNLVSGVFDADSGWIIMDGEDITNQSEHSRSKFFGRVFQDPLFGTAASMSILENLAIANRRNKKRGLCWSVAKGEKELFYGELARLGLGLEERLTTKVGLLSGGQRQALTLLMATLIKPKLLLLDEHTAALDPKTAAKVLDLTTEITAESRITTLMITHNMKDAIRLGNRLIMMHEGRILFDIEGEEKQKLKVKDLLEKFEQAGGTDSEDGGGVSDRMLLV